MRLMVRWWCEAVAATWRYILLLLAVLSLARTYSTIHQARKSETNDHSFTLMNVCVFVHWKWKWTTFYSIYTQSEWIATVICRFESQKKIQKPLPFSVCRYTAIMKFIIEIASKSHVTFHLAHSFSFTDYTIWNRRRIKQNNTKNKNSNKTYVMEEKTRPLMHTRSTLSLSHRKYTSLTCCAQFSFSFIHSTRCCIFSIQCIRAFPKL